ncbi:antibiotic biosynthesis monooxygenase [Nostoc sp. FACHB-145]|uniref:antibiotic biosynthesis monooxygenase family protein n=1 Tax=Nostoc sp. FACHB-145 TaxID=2692836 RepID=UPI001682BE85|nr:antibiotic biosynthesis monooxygenase [Nostoc sp. FACHB-145]MBD2468727.1 antibiotic biosynthesis monooxygenase [Nostoc sp. FACHB-145]
MPIVSQNNGFLAEFAVFPVNSENQAQLVQQVVESIESTVKQHSGFVSGTVVRSLDGLRVTSYIQWADHNSYILMQPIHNFVPPDTHLFEIFAQEPKNRELHLSPDMDGLINFGIFKMKQPQNQARFVELFRQALDMVAGQPGLISTHAHRSLDGWRCINFGHWHSLPEFTAMDNNRPFSPLFAEMLDLADNEYQKTLHEVVFTTPLQCQS